MKPPKPTYERVLKSASSTVCWARNPMKQHSLVLRTLAWFGENARDLPWRRKSDPYGIWVSEIMLQQTQVKTVIPYWDRWMRELPTVESLARAGLGKIHKLWEGLGYYNRVRNMRKAAQSMVERHGGRVPESFEELLGLPGIGRYTAGAICSIAFDQAKPVLDGNVIRLLTRLFGIREDTQKPQTRARLWQISENLVREAVAAFPPPKGSAHSPEKKRRGNRVHCPTPVLQRPASSFNQALMELGTLVCSARQPQCGVCPLAHRCVALIEGRVGEIPLTSRRVKSTPRRFVAFVVQKGYKLLVRQRPGGVVNAHLWEFPNVEVGRDFPEGEISCFEPTASAARVDGPLLRVAPRIERPAARRQLRAPRRDLWGGDSTLLRAAGRALGVRPAGLAPMISLRHSITRYRIRLDVFRASMKGGQSRGCSGQWVARTALKRLAFTAAHRRIVDQLMSR